MEAVFWWGGAAAALLIGLGWRNLRHCDWQYMSQMIGMLRLRGDAACLLHPDGRVAWVNEAYGNITGFSAAQLTHRDWHAFLRERVADGAPLAAIESALDGRRELRIDLMFRLANGEDRCMIVELHPIRSLAVPFLWRLFSQPFTGCLVVQVDIDKQRRERNMTMLALRDRQAVLDILDHYAIVTETDLQGRITKVNDRFLDVSGYRADEMIGQQHSMFSSGIHDDAFWRDMWNTIAQGGVWRGEVCNRAKDGSLYWLDSIIAPMLGRSGRPVKYMSIRTDITALKLSLDMLKRTGHIAGVGGWYYTPGSQTLYLTRGSRDLLGITDRALCLDRLQTLMRRMMPQQWSELVTRVRHTMDSGEPFTQEARLTLPDGRAIWVNLSGEVEYLYGKLYRLVGAVQDVSAQVEARLRVESSERILRSAIDALDGAFALYDAADRLVLCNDRYLEMFGDWGHLIQPGISAGDVLQLTRRAGLNQDVHDDIGGQDRPRRDAAPTFQRQVKLKDGRWIKRVGVTTTDGMRVLFWIDVTDLHQALDDADASSRSKSRFLANMSHEIRTPMNAIMGMMQLIEHSGISAEQRDLLRKMEGAARSLLDILNDILDFSKVEAGMMLLDTEPFKLEELLADVATILSGTLGGKRLELVYELDPAIPPLLLGDALRLKQILINLGVNAVKFTAKGEVRIQLRRLQHGERGELLAFAVQDTGIGISEDAIAHIFTGFSQAEASISRRYGGTGLGLAISHRLVELMGGQLQVQSEVGRGSRFGFQIWLQAAKNDEQPPLAQAGEHALQLEPHPVSRAAIGALLEKRGGWQVTACGDSAAALEALAGGLQPKLALLSVDVADGEPLLARLRAVEPAWRQPVILLLSSSPRTPQAGLPMLCKPITFSMIRNAIQGHSLRDQPDASAPQRRLAGVRLLLVEDNEINQEVALRLLAREGALVSVAGDGLQSIQALDAAPDAYDLVLMDMQMPVMDGLQAAQAIRSEPCFDRLPIVAMTANAMASDRQACMDVGMNDHIGKPFHLEALVNVILRHTGRAAEVVAPALSAPAPSAAETALDADDALQRLGQDRAFYRRLLRDFAPAAQGLAQRIAQALEAGRLPDARDAAHQLKSTAVATGARQLATVCAAIERSVRNDDERPALPQRVAALPAILADALAAQQAWLQQYDAADQMRACGPDAAHHDVASGDEITLAADLAALAEALQDSDLA